MLLLDADPSIPESDEYKHSKYHELQAAESSCMWPSSTPRKPANQWALKLSPQFDASTGPWKLQRSKWDNKFLWYWITKQVLPCQSHLPALNVLYLYWRISLHNPSSELPHSALDYLPTFFKMNWMWHICWKFLLARRKPVQVALFIHGILEKNLPINPR